MTTRCRAACWKPTCSSGATRSWRWRTGRRPGRRCRGRGARAGHRGLDDARVWTAWRSAGAPARASPSPPFTSSCSPRATAPRTSSGPWTPAPTTTSPSPSTPPSCGRGWAWACGGRAAARAGAADRRPGEALAHVDELHGILPVCSYCKKVRSDTDSWQQMEAYVSSAFRRALQPRRVSRVPGDGRQAGDGGVPPPEGGRAEPQRGLVNGRRQFDGARWGTGP